MEEVGKTGGKDTREHTGKKGRKEGGLYVHHMQMFFFVLFSKYWVYITLCIIITKYIQESL